MKNIIRKFLFLQKSFFFCIFSHDNILTPARLTLVANAASRIARQARPTAVLMSGRLLEPGPSEASRSRLHLAPRSARPPDHPATPTPLYPSKPTERPLITHCRGSNVFQRNCQNHNQNYWCHINYSIKSRQNNLRVWLWLVYPLCVNWNNEFKQSQSSDPEIIITDNISVAKTEF